VNSLTEIPDNIVVKHHEIAIPSPTSFSEGIHKIPKIDAMIDHVTMVVIIP